MYSSGIIQFLNVKKTYSIDQHIVVDYWTLEMVSGTPSIFYAEINFLLHHTLFVRPVRQWRIGSEFSQYTGPHSHNVSPGNMLIVSLHRLWTTAMSNFYLSVTKRLNKFTQYHMAIIKSHLFPLRFKRLRSFFKYTANIMTRELEIIYCPRYYEQSVTFHK